MRIEGFLGFGPPYVRWVDYKDMRRRYRQQSELTEAAVAEAAEWKEHAREAVRRELELEAARDYWRDRAEAAETERNTAARRAFNAEAENQLLQRELSAAEARAAELEAALAADRAAAHAPGGGVRHLESIMDLQNDLHQRLALEFSVARIGRVSCLAIVAILDVALARAAELEAAYAEENRLRAEASANLGAQLAALQHAACPHCGASLASEKLAPF